MKPRETNLPDSNWDALVEGVQGGCAGSLDQLRLLVLQIAKAPNTQDYPRRRNVTSPKKLGEQVDATMEIVAEAILTRALKIPEFLPTFIQILVRH